MKRLVIMIFSALICGMLCTGCLSNFEEPTEEKPSIPPTEPVLVQIQSMGFTPDNEYYFMHMGVPKLETIRRQSLCMHAERHLQKELAGRHKLGFVCV